MRRLFFLLLLLVPSRAAAQYVQVVQSFEAPPAFPFSGLVETPDGSFYGTTQDTIYRRAPDGTVSTVFHSLNQQLPDSLVLASDGGLYGVSTSGGRGRGAVLRFDPGTSRMRIVHEFSDSEGGGPSGRLTEAGGALYGATLGGPGLHGGSLFRVDLATSHTTTVFAFGDAGGPGPWRPVGNLVLASNGWLYGVTTSGHLFRLAPSTNAVEILPQLWGDLAPFELLATSDGALYGTSSRGGPENAGTVFSVDLASGTASTVYALAPSNGTDGAEPRSLVEGVDGSLYGTTDSRSLGSGLPGTLFRVERLAGGMHAYTTLRVGDMATIGTLSSPLTPAIDGFIYGRSSGGGASGTGTIFRFDPLEQGPAPDPLQLTVLHTFPQTTHTWLPSTPVQASDGFLYGTMSGAGPTGWGAAYRLAPSTGAVTVLGPMPGAPTTVRQFIRNSSWIPGPDGFLYGTATVGQDSSRENRILRFDPSTGTVTTAADLVDPSFSPTIDGLTSKSDGQLYGVTVSTIGMKAWRFDPQADTVSPVASLDIGNVVATVTRLVEASDGQLYGARAIQIVVPPGAGYAASLYRVDAANGAFVHVAGLGQQRIVSEVVPAAGGLVFVGAGPIVHAVDVTTGSRTAVCTFDTGWIVSRLARGPGGILFGFLTDEISTRLFRCDPATGVAAILQTLNPAEGKSFQALALGADGLLYGAADGGPRRGGTIVRVTPGGVPPALDSDGDGLSNTWESSFGLDPSSTVNGSGAGDDPDGDGFTNAEELAAGTHPRGLPQLTRFLAEGATGTFFRTQLSLANAGARPAIVLVRFLTETRAVVPVQLVLRPSASQSIDVASLAGLESANFSMVVETDEPVVVDRTMSWDATGYGSHAETAVSAASTTWHFAEGSTSGDFTLFYLLQNPQTTAVAVTVTYLLPFGAPPIVRTYTLASQSRTTIQIDAQPGLESTDVSASISATLPIIAERAMYVSRPGQLFAAGHASAGVTTPALEWFLAEGATGPFFDTFVLVANPNPTPAAITVDYLLLGGGTLTTSYTVPANGRYTIWVDDEQIPAGSGQRPLANVTLSTTVRSTNGVPVVVERTMWWPGPELTPDYWYEAHNSPGATATSTRWVFADGEVGGMSGAETYVLIANPSAEAGLVRMTLVWPDARPMSREIAVPARSRTNISISTAFPASAGKRFGVVVESLNAPTPIVVERATYASPGGVTWASGTNALAAPVP